MQNQMVLHCCRTILQNWFYKTICRNGSALQNRMVCRTILQTEPFYKPNVHSIRIFSVSLHLEIIDSVDGSMHNLTGKTKKQVRCDNTKFFYVETVKVHLYSRGFIPNYDQWSFHGEPLHYTEECEIGGAMEERVEAENEEMVDSDHVERVDVNLADPNRTMILEAAGPSFNPNANVEFDEPPD
ncbi:uncharacterized protein G2W53_017574 [Senna tora]|uniref:Transposase-associated domain-containing protein n=1 Tax=Senna tora TaxID=362788 RepID=A0A834TQL5_9FABA|nr:uncharacterized protein G2W53_017574 [Senna tora]